MTMATNTKGKALRGRLGAPLLTGCVLATAALAPTGAAVAQVTPIEIETGDNSLFSGRVLTTGLDNPWAMRWGPDNQIWVTERTGGEVTRVDPVSGIQQLVLTIDDVYTGPQHEGLLGLALHPELGQGTGNDYVYLGYTVNNGTADAPEPAAQIVRYSWNDQTLQLGDPMILIQGLPAGNDHNAGRVVFGPDGKLYYSIGEQGHNFGRNLRKPNLAQALPSADEVADADWHTYSGKILRLNLDGSVPEDNPEIDGVRSHIYSYGHRNPQGLAFGPNGTLYETEHGPASGDELNIIEPGGNYGWPEVSGYIDDKAYSYINWSQAPEDVDQNTDPLPDSVPVSQESEFTGDMVDPLAAYWVVGNDYPIGDICGYICDPTIAPSSVLFYQSGEDGIAEWDNAVLIPTLKHGTLYVQHLSADGLAADGLPQAWFSTQNRYRDVLVSPDGKTVFIATDAFGSAAQKFGEGLNTSILHNPGAILRFAYGEQGGSLGVVRGNDFNQAPATSDTTSGQEWEDPNTGKAPSGDEAAVSAHEAVTADSDIQTVSDLGLPQYMKTCSSCHGASGQGGSAPALAGNGKLADADYVANTIVHGFGYMPAFGNQLDDTAIAEIGTYIRSNWNNDFGLLTDSTVANSR
ncbi:MAG: glucose/sorbosone family PQQ-dependent dehydrogenase [Devosia sp.]